MSVRALLNVPSTARKGDIVEIRATVQHPMETGFRPGTDGRVLPRNLVRRVECQFEGQPVFAADLPPSISANPYLSFSMRAVASGTLVVTWTGDEGFKHSESARISVT